MMIGEDDEPTITKCACPEVYAGTYATGSRNWNPDCPEHGVGTEWLRVKRETDPYWRLA
jgi:hypothetical protein